MTSDIGLPDWSSDGSTFTPCGHCDNCCRPPESIEDRDVTLETWQILTIVEQVKRAGGRQKTMNQLAELVRTKNNSSFRQRGGLGKDWRADETLDLNESIGGKVTINKEVNDFDALSEHRS